MDAAPLLKGHAESTPMKTALAQHRVAPKGYAQNAEADAWQAQTKTANDRNYARSKAGAEPKRDDACCDTHR